MYRIWLQQLCLISLPLLGSGCSLRDSRVQFDADLDHCREVAQATEFPQATVLANNDEGPPTAPHTIRDPAAPGEAWELSLAEAIEIAIANSTVLRDLGGSIIQTPTAAQTIYEPALESSEPRRGMEAALSAFDASVATRLFYDRNDRLLNNFFSAGGTRALQQDLALYETEISKQTAAGTQVSLRNTLSYDRNNAAGNLFPQAVDTLVETEVRQPLLQGAGTVFNRIAGPNSSPGVINGVMVARLNTEVSLAEFQMALRDLLSNVENAYWDLYFAYRDLDARIEARNRSLEAWRAVYGMMLSGQPGGEAEREAQFREQYYRFQEDVQNSLTGHLWDGTTTFNGSSGGTFRGLGGVHVTERRLRLALGIDINDSRLIRPADEPSVSLVMFDWWDIVSEALTRRAELQRQRLQVRRRELELIAGRNFLLPRLDFVGRYRWRGLGRNWVSDYDAVAPGPFSEYFANSSLENLLGGDFQEWQVGGELTFPVGFRRAHAALRNAQLQLAREHAVLDEQERQVLHDLSNAVAEKDRAYEVSQTNYNRRLAARRQIDILHEKLDKRLPVNLDQFIDAERRYADADVQFHRSLVEYTVAVKNIHYEKGSLLDYCQVCLAETVDAESVYGEPTPAARLAPAATTAGLHAQPAAAPQTRRHDLPADRRRRPHAAGCVHPFAGKLSRRNPSAHFVEPLTATSAGAAHAHRQNLPP